MTRVVLILMANNSDMEWVTKFWFKWIEDSWYDKNELDETNELNISFWYQLKINRIKHDN